MVTVLSPNHGGALVNPIWIVVHTAQGARTDESLAQFLANPASKVSYHYICDDDSETLIVPESLQTWSALGANRYGIHLCTTGFAEWSRDEWLSHPVMLGFLADRIGEIARRRGYPIVRLADQAIRAHASGVLGHGDYARATGDGDHTDPGPNFPWDVVLARAAGTTPQEDDMAGVNADRLNEAADRILGVIPSRKGPQGEQWMVVDQGDAGVLADAIRYATDDQRRTAAATLGALTATVKTLADATSTGTITAAQVQSAAEAGAKAALAELGSALGGAA